MGGWGIGCGCGMVRCGIRGAASGVRRLMCDREDGPWWGIGGVEFESAPHVELEVDERDEEPRLLGPDGQPVARLVHRFGFGVVRWE